MSALATPGEVSEELNHARLSTIGEVMVDVLTGALAVTSTENDCAYTRAVLPWGRIRNALLNLARSGRHDWLTIKHAGNDLVIGVGSFPVRFFLDDHTNPRKHRVLSPTAGEASQLAFDFGGEIDRAPHLWRFIVERASSDVEEHRVFFIGYNVAGDIVAKWQFTDTVRAFSAVDDFIPPAAVLDPISLAPIFDDEAENSQSGDALGTNLRDGHGNDQRRAAD